MSEVVLQFGAGNFLRGFVDLFIHHANQSTPEFGRVVVVQSTGDDRARILNDSGGRYHVAVRGLENGRVVDRVEECSSISRAVVAATHWAEVIALAQSPTVRFIVSNTTEAGYALDPADAADANPPRSFPAKLRAVLHARWSAGGEPLTILPCELIEDNAVRLREQTVAVAWSFADPPEFLDWVTKQCTWLSSLVDRIVPGRPNEHPLLATDPLLISAEPYAFWALQADAAAPGWFEHPSIVRVADVRPYFLRKVRILNGAHTALLCHVGTDRFETVRSALENAEVAAWLDRVLMEEIVPTLRGRCDEPEQFARQTLERFRNPYLNHRLRDIALHHTTKRAIRLETTCREYREKFGREPELLTAALASDRVTSPM